MINIINIRKCTRGCGGSLVWRCTEYICILCARSVRDARVEKRELKKRNRQERELGIPYFKD